MIMFSYYYKDARSWVNYVINMKINNSYKKSIWIMKILRRKLAYLLPKETPGNISEAISITSPTWKVPILFTYIRVHYNISKRCVSIASSRIVNPIETATSHQEYPWMAFLLNQEEENPKKQEDILPSKCTGAVISSRYYK